MGDNLDEKVLEVTFDDTPVGLAEKFTVHQQKVLHRAFSISIIDDKNKMLVQKYIEKISGEDCTETESEAIA